MRTLRYLPPLLLSGLLAGCMHSEPSSDETGHNDAKIAPVIEGHDADGLAVKLSDLRGEVVLVDFWQTH